MKKCHAVDRVLFITLHIKQKNLDYQLHSATYTEDIHRYRFTIWIQWS